MEFRGNYVGGEFCQIKPLEPMPIGTFRLRDMTARHIAHGLAKLILLPLVFCVYFLSYGVGHVHKEILKGYQNGRS